MPRSTPEALPGDVIAFSGTSCTSWVIRLCTLGGVSHVGIVARHPKYGLRLYESLLPGGVRHVNLANRLRNAATSGARVWHYPLAEPLSDDESDRLFIRCNEQLEKPYDRMGAIRARTLGCGYLRWTRLYQGLPNRNDGESWFCSEFDADKLDDLGRFRTSNPSKWSPVNLCWALVERGICPKPVEVKL